MKDTSVDRKGLEGLLQEVLFLQYRFEFMRRSCVLRCQTGSELECSLEDISVDFDKLITSMVNVPSSGPFRVEEVRKSNWWGKWL